MFSMRLFVASLSVNLRARNSSMAAEGSDRMTLPVAMAGFTVGAVVIIGFSKGNVVMASKHDV